MVLGIAGISLRNGAATGRFRKASVRHAPTLDTDRHSEVYLDAERQARHLMIADAQLTIRRFFD